MVDITLQWHRLVMHVDPGAMGQTEASIQVNGAYVTSPTTLTMENTSLPNRTPYAILGAGGEQSILGRVVPPGGTITYQGVFGFRVNSPDISTSSTAVLDTVGAVPARMYLRAHTI